MNIEIKKSIKPINYFDAINFLEKRLEDLNKNKNKELIWNLEHNEIFTAGTSYKDNEILVSFEYFKCCLKWGLMHRKGI